MKKWWTIGCILLVILLLAVGVRRYFKDYSLSSPVVSLATTALVHQDIKAVETPEEQLVLNKKYQLDKINLPPNFHISVLAEVPNARSLTVSPTGTIFVGNLAKRAVYAVVDQNKDGFADKVFTVVDGVTMPNGVALKDGDLYVAALNKILKFPDIENNLEHPPAPETMYDGYPSDVQHGWKFIAFGPDGKLYVPVGGPCNSCVKDDPIFGSITRIDVNTKQVEVVAHGVRNSVGFDWQPNTQKLWFTDNGRDSLGDDKPTDELNMISAVGDNFGFPFCHQGDIQDPDITPNKDCSEFIPPVGKLSPHAAALGMRFYTGSQFPEEYKNQIFLAEHGSWNRTEPIGYRVMLVKLNDQNQMVSYEPFADGWLAANKEVLGRPVDVALWNDGSLLVSDDKNGVIYRITYTDQE